ncbi:MAG TPA: hypothetical protein VGD88_06195 [Opitutaceae bacterium]
MNTLTRRTAILLVALFLATCTTSAVWLRVALNPYPADVQALLDRGATK